MGKGVSAGIQHSCKKIIATLCNCASCKSGRSLEEGELCRRLLILYESMRYSRGEWRKEGEEEEEEEEKEEEEVMGEGIGGRVGEEGTEEDREGEENKEEKGKEEREVGQEIEVVEGW